MKYVFSYRHTIGIFFPVNMRYEECPLRDVMEIGWKVAEFKQCEHLGYKSECSRPFLSINVHNCLFES